MRQREEHGERSHQRVWELLPWYVNGSLDPGERERVEAHLATCSRCQEEAGLCRRTAGEITGAGEVSPSPHPVQFQRLLTRIDESEREAESLPEGGRPFLAPVRSLVRATPRPFRWLMVAQAAAIFLLVGFLALFHAQRVQRPDAGSPAAPDAPYRTLSNPEAAPVPTVRLRVMFQPKATEREIRDLLHGVSGEITAGPSPSGAYTVDVPATRDPVGVVLARLRSEPQLVMLAEPVAGGAEKVGP
ncbi:MAG TPA: zf-HC2 domain-containing protein [Thermoanaerobaculia bacterium]|nr:zf-HC2 domain-containing protein [Thermoanaerobaculia bacterium]